MGNGLSFQLTKRSVENVKKRIESLSRHFDTRIIATYLRKCCQRIVEFANTRLESSVDDAILKEKIKSSWIIKVIGETARITNTCEKSVYIEFGTGIVGSQKPYPQYFSPDPYDYDVDSPSKRKGTRSWSFLWTEGLPLDVNEKNITSKKPIRNATGVLSIRTRGQEGALFVYQAILDFQTSMAYANLWVETINGVY